MLAVVAPAINELGTQIAVNSDSQLQVSRYNSTSFSFTGNPAPASLKVLRVSDFVKFKGWEALQGNVLCMRMSAANIAATRCT